MKKVLCVLLAVITALMLCVSATAYEEELVILSELSDEELLAFLEDSGVDIPSAYDQNEDCIEFVRYIINHIEEYNSLLVTFSSNTVEQFAADIESAVLDYYSGYFITPYAEIDQQTNILEDNIVVGSWDPNYDATNCYAYAIGHPESIQPGWLANGYEREPAPTYMYDNIWELKTLIEGDLRAKHYTVVENVDISSYHVTAHQRLVCVRLMTGNITEYHFMVKQEDQNWYQKPNARAPMRYIKAMSYAVPWVYEAYHRDTHGVDHYVRDDDCTYSGPIAYIGFKIPCTMEYKYCGTFNGTGTHISTCTGCGATEGSRAICRYADGKCRICGAPQPAIMQNTNPDAMYE